jgi:hypothetical protein
MARLICFLGLGLLAACSKTEKQDSKQISKTIARVFDREVSDSEINDLVQSVKNKQDSVRIVQAYLDKLTIEEAVLQQASSTVDMAEVDAKTRDFRNSLINIRFQQAYIEQHLDTTVTQQQLDDYFAQHGSSFLLRQDIYRGYYVTVTNDIPKIQKLKELLLSNREADFEELKSYCLRYSTQFSLDKTHWSGIPPFFHQDKKALANASHSKQLVILEKDEQIHLIRVFDYKFAQQPSPASFAEANIKQIVLNKRKMELLAKLNEQLLEDAKKSNKIKTY